MREYLPDGDSGGVRDLREESVKRVCGLNFFFSTSWKIITAVYVFVIEPILYFVSTVKGFFSFPSIWL